MFGYANNNPLMYVNPTGYFNSFYNSGIWGYGGSLGTVSIGSVGGGLSGNTGTSLVDSPENDAKQEKLAYNPSNVTIKAVNTDKVLNKAVFHTLKLKLMAMGKLIYLQYRTNPITVIY